MHACERLMGSVSLAMILSALQKAEDFLAVFEKVIKFIQKAAVIW